MRRILVFGSFDPLHEGHKYLFNQAKANGDYLTVVVARDSAIRVDKGREPRQGEDARLRAIKDLKSVDEAVMGDERPVADEYRLLGELDFEILVLGYDQEPSDEVVREELEKHGKKAARMVRLEAHLPEKFKSSIVA